MRRLAVIALLVIVLIVVFNSVGRAWPNPDALPVTLSSAAPEGTRKPSGDNPLDASYSANTGWLHVVPSRAGMPQ